MQTMSEINSEIKNEISIDLRAKTANFSIKNELVSALT